MYCIGPLLICQVQGSPQTLQVLMFNRLYLDIIKDYTFPHYCIGHSDREPRSQSWPCHFYLLFLFNWNWEHHPWSFSFSVSLFNCCSSSSLPSCCVCFSTALFGRGCSWPTFSSSRKWLLIKKFFQLLNFVLIKYFRSSSVSVCLCTCPEISSTAQGNLNK